MRQATQLREGIEGLSSDIGKRPDASTGPNVKKATTKRRGSAPDDVGRALRSAYDETLREEVPEDFQDLLGKLS